MSNTFPPPSKNILGNHLVKFEADFSQSSPDLFKMIRQQTQLQRQQTFFLSFPPIFEPGKPLNP